MIVSERVVVGDSNDADAELIVCWLLAPYGYRQNAIYRLTADQCNDDARDRISAAQLRPATTLVEVRHGSVGWFDAVTVTDRPEGNVDGQEDGTTASDATVTVDDVYASDEWSFLDGSPVINVYNDPYIATDLDDAEKVDQPDAELVRKNSQQPRNAAVIISAAALACVPVMLASCL